MRPRVHSIAARASGLNELDLVAAGGRRVVVAADADRPELASGGRRRRPDGGRSRRRRRGARWRRRCRRGEDRVERRAGWRGCPRGRRRAPAEPSSAVAGCRGRDARMARVGAHRGAGAGPSGSRGRRRPVRPRLVATTSRWPSQARACPPERRDRPPPSAATARCPAASSSSAEVALPGDERRRPGASSGKAELDELGQRPTARARTRRPALAVRRDLRRASSARIGADVDPVARGRSPRRRSRGTAPSCRSTRRAAPAPAGSAAAIGQAREAAAAADVDERPDAAAGAARAPRQGCRRRGRGRSRRDRGSAVRLIAAFQASSSRTWPSMASRAPATRSRSRARRPASRASPRRREERRKVPNARRERITRTVQALLLSVVPAGPSGLRSRRRSSHGGRASVFQGRSGSRPGLPVPLAGPVTRVTSVRMPDVSRDGRRQSTGLSTNSPRPSRGCG